MLPINRSQHPVFALLFAMLFFFATAPLPWAHLVINYHLREAFALVKTFLFD